MTYAFAQASILQSESYTSLKKYSKSKNTLNDALYIAKDFKQPLMKGRIHFAFAQIYFEQNYLDDALVSFDESLDIFLDINHKLKITEILIKAFRAKGHSKNLYRILKIFQPCCPVTAPPWSPTVAER